MDTVPPIGLGTMGIDDPATIATAIELGYRHLDTAQIYGNEDVVGEGIARSDVDREELFVATKVWADRLGVEDVRPSVEESLNELGIEHVDLLYVHRPIETYEPTQTLPAFDALVDDGLIDHVGLSNFSPAELDEAREILDRPVFAHQVELHPLFQSPGLVTYAQVHDHVLVAYSPLIAGRADEIPALREIAEDHDITPTQASLAWVLSKESVVAIPKASSQEHLEANLDVTGVKLSAKEIQRIDNLERQEELFPE